MAELAAFFDSVAGDREYNSQTFADVFEGGVATEGVVRQGAAPLRVDARVPVQMGVRVNPGGAWVRGRYYENSANLDVAVPAANGALPRIDRVVVRQDLLNRTMALVYLQGVAAVAPVAPALTQTAQVWEVSLATISVPAADVAIDAGQITDTRTFSKALGPLPAVMTDAVNPGDVLLNLGSGGSQFMLEASGRQGWSAPGAARDVFQERGAAGALRLTGNHQVTGNIQAQYGTGNQVTLGVVGGGLAAGIEFGSATNWVGLVSADNLSVRTASAERLRINPTSALFSVDVSLAKASPYLSIARTSDVQDSVLSFPNAAGANDSEIRAQSGYLRMWNWTAKPLSFGTGNTERMVLDTAGTLKVMGDLYSGPGVFGTGKRLRVVSDATWTYIRGEDQAASIPNGNLYLQSGSIYSQVQNVSGDWRFFRSTGALVAMIGGGGAFQGGDSNHYFGPYAIAGGTGSRVRLVAGAGNDCYIQAEASSGDSNLFLKWTGNGALYIQRGDGTSLWWVTNGGDLISQGGGWAVQLQATQGRLWAKGDQNGIIGVDSAGNTRYLIGLRSDVAGNVTDIVNYSYSGAVRFHPQAQYSAKFDHSSGGLSTALWMRWWDGAGTIQGPSQVLNVSVNTLRTTAIYDTWRVLVIAA